MCLPTSCFCQTPYYLSIFRFEGKLWKRKLCYCCGHFMSGSYINNINQKYSYLVNGSKNLLIVKSDVLADEAKRVFGDEVNITTEGQRHLGAVTGSLEFKDQYCREKVLGWKGELEALSEIAESKSHATYTVFTKGYTSKFTRYQVSGWTCLSLWEAFTSSFWA